MAATGKREREIQKWGKGIRMILSLFTSYNKKDSINQLMKEVYSSSVFRYMCGLLLTFGGIFITYSIFECIQLYNRYCNVDK